MMSAGESDDDTTQLSAHALAALQEFYTEQDISQNQLASGELGQDMPQEDWQLSQFWYSDETAMKLAEEALAVAGEVGRIACISCPTLYKKLRELKPETCHAVILEYDNRFQCFGGDFVHYDYNKPLALPVEMKNTFDIVVADPPFLSEECLTKTALTMRYLSKEKVLLCTGAKMEELAGRLLAVKPCSYLPLHTRNLANEFRCYANYTTSMLN